MHYGTPKKSGKTKKTIYFPFQINIALNLQEFYLQICLQVAENITYTLFKNKFVLHVMTDFTYQLDCTMWCPDMWSKAILGLSGVD